MLDTIDNCCTKTSEIVFWETNLEVKKGKQVLSSFEYWAKAGIAYKKYVYTFQMPEMCNFDSKCRQKNW